MALAVLFSNLLKTFDHPKITDNEVGSVRAIIVDHKLREGSTEEALRVLREIRRIGIEGHVRTVGWRHGTLEGGHPSQLPNVESLAREKRYRSLARGCIHLHATSLFFAHHSDDQHETVLMRLLSGHGYRGLQGIRKANDIPESYDLYGVYKSGLLEEMQFTKPFLSFRPPRSYLKELRRQWGRESSLDPWDQLRQHIGLDSTHAPFPGHIDRPIDPRMPYLPPLDIEDGGVKIYRPLLEFDKDRLRATCEANGVTWFEDETNSDQTLTSRNAIRHLVREHQLPQALQKPAILALSNRARRRVDMEDAEAHRLLTREAVIEDFDPNAGTLLIKLPVFGRRGVRSRNAFTKARDQARKLHRRAIAMIAIRKLIDFITPESHLPPLQNLEKTVDRLFPELAEEGADELRRAFSIAGVLFDPVTGSGRLKWFLSRAPHPATQPPGVLRLCSPTDSPISSGDARGDMPTHRHSKWHGWSAFKLWDGRFWIRLRRNLSARFHIQPLLPEALKAFKLAMPPKQRAALERILRHYAPGKVRYTLPALYSAEKEEDDHQDRAARGVGDEKPRLTLLALPSLGFHVPGLERWVKYEVRYRKVDTTLLGVRGRRGGRRVTASTYLVSCSVSRRRRRAHLKRYRERRHAQPSREHV